MHPLPCRFLSALLSRVLAMLALCLLSAYPAAAQLAPSALQGPADVGRITPPTAMPSAPPALRRGPAVTADMPVVGSVDRKNYAPFVLTSVVMEGATVFTAHELEPLYATYIGKKTTADTAPAIANAVTKLYRDRGYFISLASIAEQSPRTGTIRIAVTQGYIGQVEIKDTLASNRVVRGYADALTQQRPLKYEVLESFLLRINSLPGLSFRAILNPADNPAPGEVKLTLIPSRNAPRGIVEFDNYGSRFLGPNQFTASGTATLTDLSQTTLTGLATAPSDELKYATITHTQAIFPDVDLTFSTGITQANPGFTLEALDIDSESKFATLGLSYQWLHQRDHDLTLNASVEGRNISSDLLDTPFTREKTRVLRVGGTYHDFGYDGSITSGTLTISQGLNAIGASEQGDLNLSRAEAEPDFIKATVNVSRSQPLSADWSVFAAGSGQLASGPLYSSEEFGYGGQNFGRAFDASELTGDNGINGSLELRYHAWQTGGSFAWQPYGFYDIGRVWNDDAAQLTRESASSAGVGVRVTTAWNQSANIALAFPLAREADTPIYGANPSGPRLSLQLLQAF